MKALVKHHTANDGFTLIADIKKTGNRVALVMMRESVWDAMHYAHSQRQGEDVYFKAGHEFITIPSIVLASMSVDALFKRNDVRYVRVSRKTGTYYAVLAVRRSSWYDNGVRVTRHCAACGTCTLQDGRSPPEGSVCAEATNSRRRQNADPSCRHSRQRRPQICLEE